MTSPFALVATSLVALVGGGVEHSSASEVGAPAAITVRACGDYGELSGLLVDRYGEQPASSALSDDGTLVQVFASTTADTWTMINVAPSGWACVLAVGRDWQQVLTLAQGQPA